MVIRLEYEGTVIEFDIKPMQEGRFQTLCAVVAAGLYVGLTISVTVLCGFPGLFSVTILTVIFAFMKLFDV